MRQIKTDEQVNTGDRKLAERDWGESARRAVVRVTSGGRGFIVHSKEGPMIVTAAHCLPKLPSAHPMRHLNEKTYENILGPLSVDEPTLWAECLYVDPMADVAVLAGPDSQEYDDKYEAFIFWVEEVPPLQVSQRDPRDGERAWLLSLDAQWEVCQVQVVGRRRMFLRTSGAGIAAGMSGSPILLDDGTVIGLVSLSCNAMQPRVSECLPNWILRQLTVCP